MEKIPSMGYYLAAMETSAKKVIGTVKMFNKEKGFGFIRTEDGEDVFFHYSALKMDSYKTAETGEKVEFVIKESERGPRAEEIVKLG